MRKYEVFKHHFGRTIGSGKFLLKLGFKDFLPSLNFQMGVWVIWVDERMKGFLRT